MAFSFECGNLTLTKFLKSHDALNMFIGTTYVIKSDREIIGYYNISTGHIEDEDTLRYGGAIYINYLAIDKKYQGKKLSGIYYSDILLKDCIERIKDLRNDVGFGFITLSSTKEGYKLYNRNGFSELEDDMRIAKNEGEGTCLPMYLPIDYE